MCMCVHVHVLRIPCDASLDLQALRISCRRFAAASGIRTRFISFILLLLVLCYIC